MNIIDVNFNWKKGMSDRKTTSAIVLHHAVMDGSVYDVHNVHVKEGYSGIGYHFYVRKDGRIYRGRPIEKMGAHAYGHNDYTVGICFEGNFSKEHMSTEQLDAGRWLIAHIKECYKKELKVLKHSDLCATECPGTKFPFTAMKKVSEDSVVAKMFEDGVISMDNVRNWELFLSEEAKPKAEYIRTIIKRYQKKIDGRG